MIGLEVVLAEHGAEEQRDGATGAVGGSSTVDTHGGWGGSSGTEAESIAATTDGRADFDICGTELQGSAGHSVSGGEVDGCLPGGGNVLRSPQGFHTRASSGIGGGPQFGAGDMHVGDIDADGGSD